jgi:hypothetical protein
MQATLTTRKEKLQSFGSGILSTLRYVQSLKWIVDLARYIQDTGAMIAESAFTLAIIYVIIYTFGHLLITWIPGGILAIVNQVVMIVFTVLPELVMLPIILTTSDHFSMARRTKDRRAYTWFIAYALLTCLFIALTLILLSGLKNGIHENTTQATGSIFILRCFSGLFYTVLQRLWDKKGKENYTSHFNKLTGKIEELRVSLSESHTDVSQLRVSLSELSNKVVTLEQEKMLLSLALADKKVSGKSHTKNNTALPESNAPVDAQSNTPINISDIREKLKREITRVVSSGKKVNYTEISKKVGVHPNTVRKHAPSIVKEITAEMPAIAK